MKKRILVVDDNRDILEALSMTLEVYGYTVQTTPKGEETFEKVKVFQPHLIILDIMLAGSDGRDICKRLKGNKSTEHIPVLMISALPSVATDAKSCGANGSICKPFDIARLDSSIREFLK